MQDDSMSFKLAWFDEMAASDRPFKLIYYNTDNSIEIIDMKSGKVHLRRIKNQEVSRDQLFVGNQIQIYGRKYKIQEFGDQQSKQPHILKEKSFVLIKPDAYLQSGKIINDLSSLGFQITRVQMLRLNEQSVSVLYREHVGKPYYKQLYLHMTSDVVIGIEVAGDNALNAIRALAGPTNPQIAKQQSPQSWRARFGSEGVKNAVHISQTQDSYKRETDLFFSKQMRVAGFTAMLSNCTLCLIKPHAIAAGFTGHIIDRIMEEGFEISAISSYFLVRQEAEEFMDLYKGVLGEYDKTIDQLVSGPCIALEVRQDMVVDQFKKLCGAYDPLKERARNTIRALYGQDRHRNAVHCSDLESEAVMEVEYFFVLLPEKL